MLKKVYKNVFFYTNSSRNTPTGPGSCGVQSNFNVFDFSCLTTIGATITIIMHLNWETKKKKHKTTQLHTVTLNLVSLKKGLLITSFLFPLGVVLYFFLALVK